MENIKILALRDQIRKEWGAMKTRLVLIAVLTGVFFMMASGAALAAYPHTDFVSSPDACAACHRMHTATAANLLKDPTGSCKSCHADGLGADTDVENGKYLVISGEDATSPHADWGANNGTLLGGGFDYVNGAATTSTHKVDTSSNIPPGANSNGVDHPYGNTIVFTCTSCHSAHLNKDYKDQYRLLRADVNGLTGVEVKWNGPWDDSTQTTNVSPTRSYRAYTDTDFGAAAGVQYYTKNYQAAISNWCAACHPHYLATTGDINGYNANKVEAGYNAGDTYNAAERHRHTVNVAIKGRTVGTHTYDLTTDMPLADVNVTATAREDADLLVCLSCHRAHGSAALMHGSADLNATARGSVLPSGTDSMLLRTDDRALCRDCHNF
jgi:predicted CXXCH cytochrome family protein